MARRLVFADGYDPYLNPSKLGHGGVEPVYRLIIGEDGGIRRVEQVPEEETLHALPKKKRPAKRLRKGMGR